MGLYGNGLLLADQHMVAPKEDALACEECHAKEGRLAHLKGIHAGEGRY